MTILHISDTHGLHNQLTDLPAADVIVQSATLPSAARRMRRLNSYSGSATCLISMRYLSRATMICACMEQTRWKDCRTMYTTSATTVLLLNHSETLATPSLNWQTWTAITTASTLISMATAEYLKLNSARRL